jgi:hypothetical protein
MTNGQFEGPQAVTAPARSVGEGWGTVRHYRQEGGRHVIDVSAGTVAQLFSGLDPAPFRHKDLDPEVDGYILSALREIGAPHRAKLVFHLPAAEAASSAGHGLADAVHNYFAYREWVTIEDMRRLLRIGAFSLLIGLTFLSLCLAARQVLFGGDDPISRVLNEGLLIVGWVALWRPLEIALYDWWPLWRQARRYRALKEMPVEVRGGATP